MVLSVKLAQPRLGDVGVNLRRGQIGMAQEELNHTQISAMVEQVSSKGMAQSVRGEMLRDACGGCVGTYPVPERLPGHHAPTL